MIWQELVDWMYSPEVQEAVARYVEPEEEEQGEPQQVGLWEEAVQG